MKTLLFILCFVTALVANAKEDVVQCGNLIFAGNNTSRCFSDEFLSAIQKQTSIATARRFRSVKLSSDELFKIPFVVMTGEADFHFNKKESKNLKRYLSSGGFMLVSSGCSSKTFGKAFKREIKRIFGKDSLKAIPMDHIIFRTVNKIEKLELSKGRSSIKTEILGLEQNGKIVMIFSPHGLNDTAHTKGCCCCGGNEIKNSLKINVNILSYALMH
jgi:uncharacterized protein DUF4159